MSESKENNEVDVSAEHHKHHHHHRHHGAGHHNNHHTHHHHHHANHVKKEEETLEANNKSQSEFSATLLFDAFQRSLRKSNENFTEFDDICLVEYIIAYKEILKFLEYLGTIFYFVISDVKEKILILEGHIEKNTSHYKTIRHSVEYEKKNDLLTVKSNASRTILRLHRALIFIYKFLDRLFSADHKCKTPQLCTETYEMTLAKYHSWWVRKTATFGMTLLPKREVLVGYMIKTQDEHNHFPTFLKTVEQVYNITQEIYEKNSLLDLP
jgi:hypothetical protein